MTTPFSPFLTPFRRNPFLQTVLALYLTVWVITAIHPVWRPQWLLDNILVILVFAVLGVIWKRHPLSDLSCLLLGVFLALHAFGSHYGYSNIPIGYWISSTFGFARPNTYDRVVHFLFGALLIVPLHEILRRYSSFHPRWWYLFPVEFILSFSAAYEIIEASTAWSLPPEQYDPFVGLQGDIWDGYRDMACAVSGAILGMVILYIMAQVRSCVHNQQGLESGTLIADHETAGTEILTR